MNKRYPLDDVEKRLVKQYGRRKLDVYIATDQPETCPRCGVRTFWVQRPTKQIHECPVCKYAFFVEEDD